MKTVICLVAKFISDMIVIYSTQLILSTEYYTSYRLSKLRDCISDQFKRCKISVGDLVHMLWSCVQLQSYWNAVITITSEVCEFHLDSAPKIWILGDTLRCFQLL